MTPTDGQSFLPQLHGEKGNPRENIYVYYWPRPEKGEPLRFVRDKRWKLYDDGRLIDVAKDVLEETPVETPDSWTASERVELPIDTLAMPADPVLAARPGDTWTFQAWYRDANPTPTSNLTDAVAVTFR